MEFSKQILLKIKRFDLSDDPEITEKIFEVYSGMDIDLIRTELYKFCEASPERQVLKIRNAENFLIPISFLVEDDDPFYYIDVALISCFGKNANSVLPDDHVDAVCNKLKALETRITRAEDGLPELEWRRQAHTEETVEEMLEKVKFLNRRFDELYPKHKARILDASEPQPGPSTSKD